VDLLLGQLALGVDVAEHRHDRARDDREGRRRRSGRQELVMVVMMMIVVVVVRRIPWVV
jgi:hypothetical protein